MRALAFATTLAFCAVTLGSHGAAWAEEVEPQVRLPLTIEKIRYRASGKVRHGDLTVTEEGLEFTARKKSFFIPMERIWVLSFGKMKYDVETNWIVMSVGVSRPRDSVGIRDGDKWGIGGRTGEIFDQLRRLFRQLSAAQYRVAPGFRIYEDPNADCSLAIPESWNVFIESLVLAGSHSPSGTTILSRDRIRQSAGSLGGRADDLEKLDAVLDGESPGIFLERSRAGRGMGCRRFSKAAVKELVSRAHEDRLFGEGYQMVQAPAASPFVVDGCEALRIRGRSRRVDGIEVQLDMVAAASNETLYVFGMRALGDRYESDLVVFETAMSTVKFGVALE
jgi:hypothetical protein